MLSRLRAALPPQAVIWLAVLVLVLCFTVGTQESDALEERISAVLSSVEGAGRVRVTITTREMPASGSTFGMDKAQRIPCGAIAVAQGADDPLVALALQEALCTLLGLPASSVSIMTGGK